jgi:hypothetical protein
MLVGLAGFEGTRGWVIGWLKTIALDALPEGLEAGVGPSGIYPPPDNEQTAYEPGEEGVG